MKTEKYDIQGMSCAACVAHVSDAIKKIKGIEEVNVNLLTNSMSVSYDEKVKPTDIIQAVEKAGYHAKLKGSKEEISNDEFEDKQTPKLLKRLILSLILLVPLFYIGMGYMLNMEYHSVIFPLSAFGENEFFVGLTEMALSFAILILNRNFFTSGFKALLNRSPNMDTLVSLGSAIAFIYSFIMLFVMAFYAKANMWNSVMKASMNLSFETAGMVPTLITIGKTLESYSKGKTTNAIKDLLDLAPKMAHVIRDGKTVDISVDELTVGDIMVILPGEKVPADGVIISGESALNESFLTGESLPVDKKEGDNVYTASINSSGALKVRVEKTGKDTTLQQIVKMVEEASSTKTKISRIADIVAGIFVPVVLAIALIVFVFWLIFGGNFVSSLGDNTTTLTYAIEKAISVLVISCPCALGLATPVAIMVGNGLGAKHNILFKSASALEETGKMEYIVLDKTGTITKGEMEVRDIYPFNISREELLALAGSIEANSEHPLSKAVMKKIKEENIQYEACTAFNALPGYGVQAKLNSDVLLAGSYKLMEEKGLLSQEMKDIASIHLKEGKTALFFAKNEKIVGIIFVSDVIKEDSKRAILALKELGLTPIMLTGDHALVSAYIASEVGLDYVISDVLPQEKLAVIKRLQKQGKVIMVGDGINDAPSLTQADIGMAIGAGSEIAISSADVILMKSTLMDAVKAIRLSRQTIKNIKENLFWAFFYNLVMIPIAAGAFAALGMAKLRPWMSAAAMAISSVTVVLNALRLNFFSLERKSHLKSSRKEVPSSLLKKEESSPSLVKKMKVSDMMCENCVHHVKTALESLPGVKEAKVDLSSLEALIYLDEDVDDKVLLKSVKDAGYKPEMKE